MYVIDSKGFRLGVEPADSEQICNPSIINHDFLVYNAIIDKNLLKDFRVRRVRHPLDLRLALRCQVLVQLADWLHVYLSRSPSHAYRRTRLRLNNARLDPQMLPSKPPELRA